MYHIEHCSEQDKTIIVDELVKYNLSRVPALQEELFIDLSRKLIGENGEIIGGIIARMYCWNCVYIDTLWISNDYRGQSLGKQLLKEIEELAKAKGAEIIHLDTFDFQAKEFYEKQGYTVFGILEDCPKDHARYYLSKKI